MKNLIKIIVSLLVLTTIVHAGHSEEYKEYSQEFNKTFTTVKEKTLFCGKPENVAYYMGFNFQLLPVSMGTGYDLYSQTYVVTFFAASKDLKTISILETDETGTLLCVNSISTKHKPYNYEERQIDYVK